MRLYNVIKNFIFSNPIKTILLFGILTRALLFLAYPNVTIYPDSEGYVDLALRLANFNLAGYDGTRSPGYPLLLVLSNSNLYITVFFQFAIGILSAIVLYKNMLLFKFSKKSALLLTLFCSSFLHIAFYETCILTESLTYFFILMVVNIFLEDFYGQHSLKKILVLSLSLSYLMLLKPFYIFIPFLMFGFHLFQRKSLTLVFSSRMLLLLFPLLTFFGWSYINKINTGYFVPTTFYGFNIAQNCVSFAEKAPAKYDEISAIYVKYREIEKQKGGDISMTIWQAHPELEAKTKLSLPDLSFLLNEFSSATIKANPKDYIKQVFISWNEFWRTGIYWDTSKFATTKTATIFIGIWHFQHYVLRFFKIIFLISLLTLFVEWIKNRKISPKLIISSIIITTSLLQAVTTYGTNSRFSYPFETLMIIVVFLQLKKFKNLCYFNNLIVKK
jgi:hypothetical protein